LNTAPDQTTFPALELALALIKEESVTPATGSVFDVLEAALENLGFRVWRVIMSEPHPEPVENLYARRGTGAPNFCFAGHLDVVPPGPLEAWSVPPFEGHIADGKIVARGANDMKTAVAAFVTAVASHIAASTNPDAGSISFLITGDEEGTALNGTKPMLDWLAEKGEVLDHCLVGEPTSREVLGDMVKIGRRGSLNARLHVRGAQGHVAYPALADNPMPRLLEMLKRLSETELDQGTDHFQPSNLEIVTIDTGNGAPNVIPPEVVAGFNIRFNNLHNEAKLITWIESICAQVTAQMGGSYHLDARASGEAFQTEPGPFTALIASAITAVTGTQSELSTSGGTSDARFITNACPVAEFGLVGQSMHKADEHTSLADLDALTQIYTKILADYFAVYSSGSPS
jgi:succinyl-diaminopimelate desuccinylase